VATATTRPVAGVSRVEIDSTELSRREVLQLVGGVGVAGAGAAAGLGALDEAADAETVPVSDDESRRLAERFAPTLYFDARERWFPTDPRPYASDRRGETIVDGFDALDGYTRRFDERGVPPDPTVFYHAVQYVDSPLAVVQFWLYSAFDQFATNFHWHDWEVVHVFVDLETDDPQLYVASAHSRTVPNNEFLDPDRPIPRILPELGSHSSALSVNDRPDSFQRLPTADAVADVTNSVLEAVESIARLPAAYGLPRDEGGQLPYVLPELDGRPLYDHDRLPSIDREAFLDPALTVRSFGELESPPSDLPARETERIFAFEGRDGRAADADPTDATPTSAGANADDDGGGDASFDADASVDYRLVPTAELEGIAAFTGPQLSFEFAVPGFVEDAMAGHVTTAGVPWEQSRYANPAEDVTDPTHRSALADRYEAVGAPRSVEGIVAVVERTVADADAPDGEGVSTTAPAVEAVCLLESDPVAAPTFGDVVARRDVPPGDHRLTVNGPGFAPHSERVSVPRGTDGGGEGGSDSEDGGPVRAGVDGTVALTATEDAVKLRVDADGTDAALTRLAVEDDFGGRLYDAPLDGPDAVYVHREGAYTTEVVDGDGEVGAFRVNPGEEAVATVERPDTGKASLASFLAALFEETGGRVRGESDERGEKTAVDGGTSRSDEPSVPETVSGLARALDAVASAAARASERAAAGDAAGADDRLGDVLTRLDRIADRPPAASGELPAPVAAAVDRRLAEGRKRAEQARAAEKL